MKLQNCNNMEGGEIVLAYPPANTNFTSDVYVDVCGDAFRVFTTGHNGLVKVFNFDFADHLGGDMFKMYHTGNITRGTGSAPSSMLNNHIYLKYS